MNAQTPTLAERNAAEAPELARITSRVAMLAAMLNARRAERMALNAARVAYREGNPGHGRQHERVARAEGLTAARLAEELARPVNAALADSFALRVRAAETPDCCQGYIAAIDGMESDA